MAACYQLISQHCTVSQSDATAHTRTHLTPRFAQPLEQVLGIGAFDLKRIVEMEPDFLGPTGHHHTHDSSISSVGIRREGTLDLDKLNSWMGTLLKEKGTDIYRSKGVLSIKGMAEKFVFQGVHMTFNGEPQSKWGADEKRENRMVFIGKNLDRKALNDGFEACILPDE